MAKLFRRVQLASALEASTGTQPSGLWAAGNIDIGLLDADFSPDVETFDREFSRTSVSRVKGTQGQKAIGFSFGTELVGTTLGTVAAGAPGFAKWFQAAGLRQVQHGILDLDDGGTLAITGGPFRHGEVVSLTYTGGTGTSAGTAKVIHDTHNGDAVIYLWDVTAPGGPNNDSTDLVVLGAATGASVTITDIEGDTTWGTEYNSVGGFSWWPISEPLKALDTDDTIDNAATNGDLIEGATSGARAIFVATTADSPKKMQFLPVRGTFGGGEVLNNLTTAVKYSDTAGTTNEAFVYGGSISARMNLDGTYVDVGGARANVTLACEVNRQVRVNVESRGFFGTVADLPLLSSDSISATTPPLWQGTDTYFADNEDRTGDAEDRTAEIIPCLSGLELNLGAQFGDRRCASAASGLEEVLIQDRQGSANIKTEATYEADIDFLGKLKSGVVMRTRFTVGTVAGNQFYVTAPGLQFESAGQENSNGVRVYNMAAKLTGGAINNLSGADPTSLSGIGGDNELVISYNTSA